MEGLHYEDKEKEKSQRIGGKSLPNQNWKTKKESETGIKYIAFDEIPVKSPNASPVDFSAFGLLERALGKRHPRRERERETEWTSENGSRGTE
ncbi:hypothetical protein TNCV_34001 [Trichonephila clavipes]|nr:hypothetical protein TNCV_34001 [Trichonephila clavipes]